MAERVNIRRRVGPSSSRPQPARPAYYSTKFRSQACEEQFQLDMLHRSVTISKYVDFTGWESMQIREMFNNIGLDGVYSVRGDSIDRVVRLFYANMSFSGQAGTIKTYILGTEILITPADVNRVIGFVGEGAEQYYQAVRNCPFIGTAERTAFLRQINRNTDIVESLKPRAKDLNIKARVIHNMVSHTLLPRHGHRDLVNFMDLYVMEKLYSGTMFDPDFLILSHMCEIGRTRNKNLPYGVLILKMMDRFQIEIPQGEQRRSQQASEVFGRIHLVRMGLIDTNGVWTSRDEEPQDDVHVEAAPATVRPETSRPDVDSLTDRVTRVEEKMTEMMNSQRDMMDSLRQMMNYQRDMFDYQRGTRQIILDWIGANDDDSRHMGGDEDEDQPMEGAQADAQPMGGDDDEDAGDT